MFHGRIKDMLKVGGENVAAAEIEGLLGRHPAVKLAQVVGIPDAKYVEVPAAFVELKPGSKATEQELIDFCRKRDRELQGAAPRALRDRVADVDAARSRSSGCATRWSRNSASADSRRMQQ